MSPALSQHPYQSLPDKAFWKRSVASVSPSAVDPVGRFGVRIDRETKVATAGSCFAQHIARHLRESGYRYYVTEAGHSLIRPSVLLRNGYGLFSARYGNLYTARQLLQTFDRAFGRFAPSEPAWLADDGAVVDPFRPTVQPGGYVSLDEMLADRAQHLAAVRRMFETLDVFIFTLGLTECWRSRLDGAVFPLCPGVAGGQFDSERHEFYNQGVQDVIADMTRFTEQLARVNPKAQVILTVSPVPLAATAQPGAHVLSATTYSKSVLRVAAEVLTHQFAHVHYFPSYEIITGAASRGAYYAEDLRNVLEDGVSHVMRVFLAHATADESKPQPGAQVATPAR
jgi:GSCFA family